MTGEDVNLLAIGSGLRQVSVNLPSSSFSRFRTAHAVLFGEAVGQRLVHRHDDCLDFGINCVSPESFLEPLQLFGRKLIGAGIVEVEEIDTILLSMEIRLDVGIGGIVGDSLLPQYRLI